MRLGSRMGDAAAIDALLRDGLHDAFSGQHSGWHTEDLVQKFGVTRAHQDVYAAESQRRFAAARQAGWFDAEIAPITIKSRKGDTVFARDDSNRPETTVATLAKLRPAFRPDGTITAGNAPGINAGASAMIVTGAEKALSLGLEPMLVVRSVGLAAVEPGLFGMAPIPAIRQALSRAGWKTADVDRFEVNEAFAAVALAIRDELGIDPEKYNIDGGAIAHGHPIGATGAILITKVAHALQRTSQRKAVVALCIGGGQGIALCLERP
jgi:acetyl-CoA C-acetyltransferase